MRIGKLEIYLETWDKAKSWWDPSGWLFGMERHRRASIDDFLLWCGPWHLAVGVR